MSIIRKEKFIFVEAAENHNKFWYIEEHDSGLIKTIWGRVGHKESTSEKQFGALAKKEYNRLVKSKLKKGYTRLATVDSPESLNKLSKQSLENIALEELTYDRNNNVIIEMIKRFCSENIHNITSNTSITFNSDMNVFQTPCGIVTIESIQEARTILSDIYTLVDNHKIYGQDFINYAEKYCMLIPQKIKGRFDANKLFSTISDVKYQMSILDNLEDSIKLIEDLAKNTIDNNRPKLFNTSIIEVTDNEIIESIKKRYEKTRQSIHACRNLKVKRIFEIKIDKMFQEYNELRESWIHSKKRKNTRLLWHGTKTANIISILKNGFVIPPSNASHVCGRMFGPGIYLSDQSTKALNYAYGWWSGSKDKNCYMFLCDVMMGKSYTPTNSCKNIPAGYDSIFAKAGISSVQNNEMIVNTNQVNPKYLIEFYD